MAGKPYFTGFLRVAFLNSGFATKLSLGCSDICKMHKYRIEKEDIIIQITQWAFWVPKMPSSKDGYFCTHSGQKMLHFRDKDIPEKNHDLQRQEQVFV